MSRKKNKNRQQNPAPVPAAQVFTDLEDEFFQSGLSSGGPGGATPPGSAGAALNGVARDTRPRPEICTLATYVPGCRSSTGSS